MSYISYSEIINHLPIQEGDTLLLSSDVSNLYREAYNNGEKLDLNRFIDSIITKIGSEGTLLIPTYNWDFCKGITYDYIKTPCKTGAIGSAAIKRSDFERTQHPIYSFAVWGKDKQSLASLTNKSSFGLDSPFAYLYQKRAKNLIINVKYTDCFTFVHFVEEVSGIREYRYIKSFQAGYIDKNQVLSTREYTMLVRNLDLEVENNLVPLGIEMENNGISKMSLINNVPFYVVDLYSAYEMIMDDVKYNRSKKICKYLGQ